MYKINLQNIDNPYEYNELIKIFLNPKDYVLIDDEADIYINKEGNLSKQEIKVQIYKELKRLTGKSPEWGTLTGVRPVKLAGQLYKANKDYDKTLAVLKEQYLLSDEKAKLILDTYLRQQKVFGKPEVGSSSMYIGIPFCPTRCSYCSFTSNQVNDSEKDRYVDALIKEIDYVASKNNNLESIYIGGGTPTSLSDELLDKLLTKIEDSFDLTELKEYTVEAGRPDTITKSKLEIIKKHKTKRISINPQTMNDRTLEIIGRKHQSKQIFEAFKLAKELGFKEINADIIAGLPGEDLEDFVKTLKEVIGLKPTNITVHSLAVKRSSKLHEMDADYHYRQGDSVREMLKLSRQMLSDNGYNPYYLYRQKHMAGALENIGYALDGSDCLYNVRIMEEQQSIIALGAGGVSKIYFPKEDRHERVANVNNYEIYIERIDEMINRKELNYYGGN